MSKMTSISSVLLCMILGMAFPSAYGDMGEKDKMMGGKKEMMEGKRIAMLAGAKDHHASGTVAIVKDQMGHPKLVFNDFKIDKVPDGRVYLAKDGDYAKGIEIGTLTRFSGKVEFPIAAGVNPEDYNSVVVWCKKFDVEIGHAFFEKEMTMKDDSIMHQKMGK